MKGKYHEGHGLFTVERIAKAQIETRTGTLSPIERSGMSFVHVAKWFRTVKAKVSLIASR